MASKRKVLAASCVMLFIGPLLAAFQCCGLLFQCRVQLFRCCGLLLALRNGFLDIVQHNIFDMFGWPRPFILFFWRRWGCAGILLPFRRLWLCYRNYIIGNVLVQRQSFVLCLCFLICKLLILFILWCRLKYSLGRYVHMYNLATPSLFVHQSQYDI
jgi:hypothetical protein